ncbi:hypothetical protein BJ508DRAFT_336247 [Ascobolus immersus RN42]|uniref:Uncharacterized protein n=1 Tax=Ascobolus immersus RN42 TaxID=1160509 RepID=A0A3N4HBU7_ASCIM|nr:hypothetical protein BJ508DRAFT_336247 [Ascobolus immersus RN42]
MPYKKNDLVVLQVYVNDADGNDGRDFNILARITAVINDGDRYFVATKHCIIEDVVFESELQSVKHFSPEALQAHGFELDLDNIDDMLPRVVSVKDAYYYVLRLMQSAAKKSAATTSKRNQPVTISSTAQTTDASTVPKTKETTTAKQAADASTVPKTKDPTTAKQAADASTAARKAAISTSKTSDSAATDGKNIVPSKAAGKRIVPSKPTRHRRATSNSSVVMARSPTTVISSSDEKISNTAPSNTTATKPVGKTKESENRNSSKRASSYSSIASIDYYSPAREDWEDRIGKFSELVDCGPAIKFAQKHSFPTLKRLLAIDCTEAAYSRLHSIPFARYTERYSTTRFYHNFRVRHPSKRKNNKNPEYAVIDSPPSDTDEEGDKRNRGSKKQVSENVHKDAIRGFDDNTALPYHKQWQGSSPYGYYLTSVPYILECLIDPHHDTGIPDILKKAYDVNGEAEFGSFEDWVSEVIVPMVVREWMFQDLHDADEMISIPQVEKLMFSRRTATYGQLIARVTGLDRMFSRLERIGLGDMVERDSDAVYCKGIQSFVSSASFMNAFPRRKLKLYKSAGKEGVAKRSKA